MEKKGMRKELKGKVLRKKFSQKIFRLLVWFLVKLRELSGDNSFVLVRGKVVFSWRVFNLCIVHNFQHNVSVERLSKCIIHSYFFQAGESVSTTPSQQYKQQDNFADLRNSQPVSHGKRQADDTGQESHP